MEVLAFLIPISVGLGTLGLVAFVWMLRSGQFDDPDGNAARILMDRDAPSPETVPKDQAASLSSSPAITDKAETSGIDT